MRLWHNKQQYVILVCETYAFIEIYFILQLLFLFLSSFIKYTVNKEHVTRKTIFT